MDSILRIELPRITTQETVHSHRRWNLKSNMTTLKRGLSGVRRSSCRVGLRCIAQRPPAIRNSRTTQLTILNPADH
jgi:hypothetical protein